MASCVSDILTPLSLCSWKHIVWGSYATVFFSVGVDQTLLALVCLINAFEVFFPSRYLVSWKCLTLYPEILMLCYLARGYFLVGEEVEHSHLCPSPLCIVHFSASLLCTLFVSRNFYELKTKTNPPNNPATKTPDQRKNPSSIQGWCFSVHVRLQTSLWPA